jgi:GNAT superfamily N-acetyltransferase
VTGLVIRTALPDDLPHVLYLLDQLREGMGSDTPPEQAEPGRIAEVWRTIIGDPRRLFLVTELDGVVVGTADVSIIPNVTHGARPSAFAERVVVNARHRGRGIGGALMEDVIARAESAGCYKVAFLSNKKRERAHAFYRRLGFEPTSEGFRLDLPLA